MAEVRPRPGGDEETGVRPGSRRSIYLLEPPSGMVDRFQAVTGHLLDRDAARDGLRAAINPAAEHVGCGAGLLTWHRDNDRPKGDRNVIDSHVSCPLMAEHHGSHITPDGLHVWEDDDDDDEW